jgi:hypothetical protein
VAEAKGYAGETCAEAIRASIRRGEVVRFTELDSRVRAKGAWRDETRWQHLMSCVVNLPPARRRWEHREPFLFIRPDGQYELYEPGHHPKVVE